ncbi:hypothetical protein [Candidatus Tisiphia endosymbiont of Parasteatoda lunata]|uniref:hypothetical protein n=1 Tax=Candidatus Tisiphia endosymbiont of Parasteatoda lunata TaxID=3066275 RepID=UPI00313E1C06
MPIENIIKSQKQGKLFGYKLKEELNSNNKLYKLRELVNHSALQVQSLIYNGLKKLDKEAGIFVSQ